MPSARRLTVEVSIAGLAGLLAGVLAGAMVASDLARVPLWLVAPFAALLVAIATGPLFLTSAWHRHYPSVAFGLGFLVFGYYLSGFGDAAAGFAPMSHAVVEYVAFIALVGGLFLASAGIVVDLKNPAGPAANTILLGVGAVLANVIGTTGASLLLIRPFLKANSGRLTPLHAIFFIFIVSNCGGSLTPIGDPPLYLGYLKGVPFFWTLTNLWQNWALVVGLLLAAFFVMDTLAERRRMKDPAVPGARMLPSIAVRARPLSIVLLLAIVACVFVDPLLHRLGVHLHAPVGAIIQIVLGVNAFLLAPRENIRANGFTFDPLKEVGLLFVGIFLTMVPALAYLSQNGSRLGDPSPAVYYFATGALSAVLDNAPTYLNFLQLSVVPQEVNAISIASLLAERSGARTLVAISTGAVFFGAMTYIGNGPNFMVRSICESSGLPMPSFFKYAAWACAILLPILVIHWALLIR